MNIQPGIIEIDLHGLKAEDAVRKAQNAVYKANNSVYIIRLIHGYHGGTRIKEAIEDEFSYGRDEKVKSIRQGSNPGITELVLIYLITLIENRINYLKSQNKLSKNYENKLVIDEINILVSSFNYLQEYDLLYDQDVKDRYDEVNKEVKQFFKESETIDEELSPLVTQLRYLRNYFNNKDKVQNVKTGTLDDQEDSMKSKILYEAAVKYFKNLKINPNKIAPEELESQIQELREKYKEAKVSFEELKDERQKLYQVSQNLSKTIGIEPIPPYKKKTEEIEKPKKGSATQKDENQKSDNQVTEQ